MAKNLLPLVQNVAVSGNLFNQASTGFVAVERTEAMVLSSPRRSMPTIPAFASYCPASRDLALSAGKIVAQATSWPTGKPFPGQIRNPILDARMHDRGGSDSGYANRPESLAGLPAGLARG